MLETYRGHGVEFQYPEHWELDEQESGGQISITVASPGTSFWSLSLFPGDPRPDDLVESALSAFRDEYDELDVYPTPAGAPPGAVARDLEFVCLELINSAFVRAFRVGRRTALVLYQGNDRELEQTRDALEAISRSLRPLEG